MATSTWADFMVVATCTLGFISLCKLATHVLWWLWVMFLRPPKNLKHYGSWAIVTGCTDGIGKALTFELASRGLNLVLVGRNPRKLHDTWTEIRERHPDADARVVEMDLGSIGGEEIMKRMEEATEGLDVGVLVNNAGTVGSGEPRFFHEGELETMEQMIKVNMEGLTWMTKAVIPQMLKKKKGAIINIGSGLTVAFPSYPLNAVYAATKEYVRMMSRSMSLEYKEKGIDIQCQEPLYVATKMIKREASWAILTAEEYSRSSMRWFGYEKECEPHPLHSLQAMFVRLFPDSLINSLLLRFFTSLRNHSLQSSQPH
ncbi:very-long-chain 3-oxoacyl-CoA reductase 1-like [Neltuma alba]|uniref:very-long-chain 3-oxoacyl-CoA reductase 1-like n=1 Tax=Neltuma alba TaxID=207710 RepID=UPI0010A5311F|nr:very-long-chain 3-oxoacyl-CoA reductase 1-like [Prosopis alba]